MEFIMQVACHAGEWSLLSSKPDQTGPSIARASFNRCQRSTERFYFHSFVVLVVGDGRSRFYHLFAFSANQKSQNEICGAQLCDELRVKAACYRINRRWTICLVISVNKNTTNLIVISQPITNHSASPTHRAALKQRTFQFVWFDLSFRPTISFLFRRLAFIAAASQKSQKSFLNWKALCVCHFDRAKCSQ